MTELLIYIGVNLIILAYYFRKEIGVFQFPFLIACVSLTFVTPQLLNLLENGYFQSFDSSAYLIFLSACNISLAIGYNRGYSGRNKSKIHISFIKNNGFKRLIYGFFIIGVAATLMNRGVYKGGFVSGTFVIISFFASFGTIALLLILIGFKRKLISSRFFFVLAFIVVMLIIDKITASGRRAATVNLALMILYFYLDRDKRIYQYLRYVVPAFFIIGMLLGSQIGKYRENAYAGQKSFWENIQSLDLTQNSQSRTLEKGELYNAFEGMQAVSLYNSYDYGAYNWNGIVKNYVPTALVSQDFKQNLMFKNESNNLVAYLTQSGSTMTGYFDSYLSFGIFGFVKFFLIGWLMGLLWQRKDDSDICILLYFALITPGLHLLTHSSNYFVSQLFFLWVFVYPFLKMQTTKVYHLNYLK